MENTGYSCTLCSVIKIQNKPTNVRQHNPMKYVTDGANIAAKKAAAVRKIKLKNPTKTIFIYFQMTTNYLIQIVIFSVLRYTLCTENPVKIYFHGDKK